MTVLKESLKELRHTIRNYLIQRRSRQLILQLQNILSTHNETPVIIVSYNNGTYTENMCRQLNARNITPIIIDNHSTAPTTIIILKRLQESGTAKIAYSDYNFGHGVGFIEPVYRLLPTTFAYTDPDLQLNENLPENFLETLHNLTNRYSVFKAGFALEIENSHILKDTIIHSKQYKPIAYQKTLTIYEHEKRYWTKQLCDDDLEIYAAPIDTTFALYNKNNYDGDFHSAVRVAGDFSAIHLPWFEDIDIMSTAERDSYNKSNKSTTWSK